LQNELPSVVILEAILNSHAPLTPSIRLVSQGAAPTL